MSKNIASWLLQCTVTAVCQLVIDLLHNFPGDSALNALISAKQKSNSSITSAVIPLK